jgi:hypothetical protein
MVDFGEFPGSHKGYAISEGTEQEISLALMKYGPFVKFKVFPYVSLSQIEENMKTLSQMQGSPHLSSDLLLPLRFHSGRVPFLI